MKFKEIIDSIIMEEYDKAKSALCESVKMKAEAAISRDNILNESDVIVDTGPYEIAHGTKPRGRGTWFFTRERSGPNFQKDEEGEDYIQVRSRSFVAAKREAIKWAKKNDIIVVYVAP